MSIRHQSLLFCLLVLSIGFVSANVRVQITPSGRAIYNIGDEVRIRCYVITDEEFELEIVKDERAIGAESLESSPSGNELTYVIRSFESKDRGVYRCRAISNGEDGVSEEEVLIEQNDARPTRCESYEATCPNGACIPRNAICDGRQDCSDGFDEASCAPVERPPSRLPQNVEIDPIKFAQGFQSGENYYDRKCEPTERVCNNRWQCKQKMWFCDGEPDCDDGSDETYCPSRESDEKCEFTHWLCRNGNQCVKKAYLCDGNSDCTDGSDEIGCVGPRVTMHPNRTVERCIGDKIVIECRARGFPAPFINWRYNWDHICPGPKCCNHNKFNGDETIGVLTIHNAVESDSGAYSCEPMNVKERIFAIDSIVIVRRCGDSPTPYTTTTTTTTTTTITELNCFYWGTRIRRPNECICNDGYGGRLCDECIYPYEKDIDGSGRCIPAIQCSDPGTRQRSHFRCDCHEGYTGLICNECADGYVPDSNDPRRCIIRQIITNCVLKGTLRQRSDGTCECKPCYAGERCNECADDCKLDSYARNCISLNYQYIQGSPVKCNPKGTESNDGFKCKCKIGYTGSACELCADGYYLDEKKAICAALKTELGCNSKGTNRVVRGNCVCKAGHTGRFCESCVHGYYQNPVTRECIECFCNGLDVECKGANDYFYNKESSDFSSNDHEWTVVNLYGNITSHDVITNDRLRQFEYIGTPGKWFFSAPGYLKGNRLASYGGTLSFTIVYQGELPREPMNLEVKIQGNKIGIIYKYSDEIKPYEPNRISIPIIESSFQLYTKSGPIAKKNLLMVLQNIENIMISASFSSRQSLSAISEFNFQIAKPYLEQSTELLKRAKVVEICSCPHGYIGTSCESCDTSLGYDKESKTGSYWGLCEINCNRLCNGHSNSCDENKCYNCKHNTTGDRCERCAPGYSGDARVGSQNDCFRSRF